jgi:hypothetical protein
LYSVRFALSSVSVRLSGYCTTESRRWITPERRGGGDAKIERRAEGRGDEAKTGTRSAHTKLTVGRGGSEESHRTAVRGCTRSPTAGSAV